MIALVSTIGESQYLVPLVKQLQTEVDHIVLAVNRENVTLPPMPWHKIERVDYRGSIYAGWDIGLDRAEDRHDIVAILNDDVMLAPRALTQAGHLMLMHSRHAVVGLDYELHDVAPTLDTRRGSYRHGGLPGWAFIVDPSRTREKFDDAYEWWYGDDDFFFRVDEEGGTLGVAQGCWVKHDAETTASKHPWTIEARGRDHERFVKRWGDR